jgi:hypothetical protein
MTTRETRFVGNGNIWVANGAYRGWQTVCSQCGVSKLVGGHKSSTLPPSVIVKKLTMEGWYIGRKEADDLCPNCRRKHRKATPQHEQRPVSVQLGSPASIIDHLQRRLAEAQQSSDLGHIKVLVAGVLRLVEPLRDAIRSMLEKDREAFQLTARPEPLPTPLNGATLARFLGIDWERDDEHKIAAAFIEKFGLEKTGEIAVEVEALLSKRRNKPEPDAEAEEYEAWLAELDRAHHAQTPG